MMKDPSPWEGQMCSRWHIYTKHIVNFRNMSTFVIIILIVMMTVILRHMPSTRTIETVGTSAPIATKTAVTEFQRR